MIDYFWSKATSGTHQTQTEDFNEVSDKHAKTREWDPFSFFLIKYFFFGKMLRILRILLFLINTFNSNFYIPSSKFQLLLYMFENKCFEFETWMESYLKWITWWVVRFGKCMRRWLVCLWIPSSNGVNFIYLNEWMHVW